MRAGKAGGTFVIFSEMNNQHPTSNARHSLASQSAAHWMLDDVSAFRRLKVAILLIAGTGLLAIQPFAKDSFTSGVEAYETGDFAKAAKAFRDETSAQPASGAYQNLGNAEWRLGHACNAIVAWERALWLNPFDGNSRTNLMFARDAAQLEAPELRWYEAGSTWMPRNFWAWLMAISLWLVVGIIILPTVLRWQRASWHQALAALGLGVFLLSLPANLGVWTRSRIGFVLGKNIPLRFTPTEEAEAITKLAAGEPARLVRARGNYLFIRTSRNAGWVERSQFELISPR
jgi:tetratricopeptide (TPR) repeat protein